VILSVKKVPSNTPLTCESKVHRMKTVSCYDGLPRPVPGNFCIQWDEKSRTLCLVISEHLC